VTVSTRILAYAKLNLSLRVVGRRADGYHELQSLVTAMDLADEITLTAGGHGVTLDAPPELGPPEGNLAFRAARALLGPAGPGVRIALSKRIPAGAGLGGGSSDAAAVLAGVNQLLGLGKTVEELKAIGITLGADVPFFLGPSPAWVEGIGDRVTPVEVSLPPAFLILVPTFRCPTPDVYRTFDDLGLPLSVFRYPSSVIRGPLRTTDHGPRTTDHQVPSAISASLRWDAVSPSMAFENDLWPAAVHLYPDLAPLRARLAEVSRGSTGMTGSGSALFAAFASRADADEARDRLRPDVEGDLIVACPIRSGYRNQG
jgi:4-diphosphocytidyl-2-C-methyl-D-erythritol kinase